MSKSYFFQAAKNRRKIIMEAELAGEALKTSFFRIG